MVGSVPAVWHQGEYILLVKLTMSSDGASAAAEGRTEEDFRDGPEKLSRGGRPNGAAGPPADVADGPELLTRSVGIVAIAGYPIGVLPSPPLLERRVLSETQAALW